MKNRNYGAADIKAINILGDKLGRCVIKDNFLFLYIPKNASTSLVRSGNGLHFDKPYKNYFDLEEKVKSKIITSTVIRNPLNRFVSVFLEMIIHPQKYAKLFERCSNVTEVKKFIDYTNEIFKNPFEGYYRNQYLYFSGINIDYFILMNNLNEDFKVLARKFNLPIKFPLPKINTKVANKRLSKVRNNIHNEIKNDNKLYQQINDICKEDLKIYNKIKNRKDILECPK